MINEEILAILLKSYPRSRIILSLLSAIAIILIGIGIEMALKGTGIWAISFFCLYRLFLYDTKMIQKEV